MSYTVLARRYRSTGFDQVVGQDPIARTLKNAIACGRVAHAYLFTGTRGVGKTSMARIMATALNAPAAIEGCPKLPGEHAYPSTDIQQRMAEAIMRGDDLNVIEIDGASNRSVDEARQLIANAALAPTGHARFKIYIIDEVHMLTREAFNALLKTMEEPPSHVKFILCTTEAHKVPTTIQSRCQRFDFRNIPTAAIAEHLGNVLVKEKIEAQKQVVWQVAKLGNGSMRDALSLLDRLIAASGVAVSQAVDAASRCDEAQGLTVRMFEQMLGLPDQDVITSLVDTFAQGDVAGALQLSARFLQRGIAQDQLIDVLIEQLRQLLLIIACGSDSQLVELSDEARATAAVQSEKFDAAGIVYMIALCENLQRSSRGSANPRALFDAVIVRLAMAEKMADVTAVLSQGRLKPEPSIGDRRRAEAEPAAVNSQAKKKQVLTPPETTSPIHAADAWASLLQAIGDKPAMAWVHHLVPVCIDSTAVRVSARPGHRELIGFINAHRRQQLADLLKPILGRPISVELEAAGAGHSQETSSTSTADGGGGSHRRPSAQTDRSEARNLPLVKQVLEVFDATMVSAQRVENTAGETHAATHFERPISRSAHTSK